MSYFARGHYPAQCKCGHLFLERYQFKQDLEDGACGFVWCGFCRNKVMVFSEQDLVARQPTS